MDKRLRREIRKCNDMQVCLRKANQAWDMAGLARMDRDHNESQRRTEEARAWDKRRAEIIKKGSI